MASLLRFEAPSLSDWEEQVRRLLAPEPLESLAKRTPDGIEIQSLYTAAMADGSAELAGLPGEAPFTRGAHRHRWLWELRQRHDLGEPAETSAAIAQDVVGGASSVWLRLRRPPAPGELLAALARVNPAETPVTVDGGPWFAAAAEATAALAGATSPGGLAVPADPLGALARHGFLLCSSEAALAQVASQVSALQAQGGSSQPGGRVRGAIFAVDATVYADAGAPPALELACLLATSVAYLRSLESAGVPPSQATQHLEARLGATADQFATICKFRAARRLWDRVLEACGVARTQRRALRCWAITSEAMFAAQDPFVNLIRATTAAFAAAAGGAECLTILPYDVALGEPSEQGRRLARNISHLLAEESHLGVVADPAGGSWYVEDRTARLAEAAWEQFREIQAAGGMSAVLQDGWLAARLAEAVEQRAEHLRTGVEQVVGVTCYPPPTEERDLDPQLSVPDATPEASTPQAVTPAPVDAALQIAPLKLQSPGNGKLS